MSVSLVALVTPDLEVLWTRACKDVSAKRGGVALLHTLSGGSDVDELLKIVVASSSLWDVRDKDELRGFGLLRGHVVEAIYVDHDFRRHRFATKLMKTLLASDDPPLDAYALPGDRAMKSLYESIGWKARLLTMRGA
jgi:GNAT superfamily N-acetyltransferase